MLDPRDAELVRRDAAIPGLATLLDPEQLVAQLREALPHAELGPAEITYLKYKPATNCLAAYRLQVAGGAVDLHAKALRALSRGRMRRAACSDAAPGPLGPGRIVLEDDAIIVSTFPNDAKVTCLPLLASSEGRQRVLRDLLPDDLTMECGTLERLAYKPERRYVGRLTGAGGRRVALKAYTTAGYAEARGSVEALADPGRPRLATCVAASDRHRILAFEWVDGQLLSETLAKPRLGAECVTRVGAALGRLHARDSRGLALVTRETAAEQLVLEESPMTSQQPCLSISLLE